jgi:hypothetical protein
MHTPRPATSPFSHTRRRGERVTHAPLKRTPQEKFQRTHQAVLRALTAFATARRHTLVPLDEKAADGTPYGLTADRWREAHARGDLPQHAIDVLEGIGYWTWHRTPATPPPAPRIPRPAPRTADTSPMNRSGLRQFRPDDA